MLARFVTEYPDELEADFWRSYGCSWRDVPVWRAAILAWPLATRPECELCRILDPEWWWREPLFIVVARFMGLEPEQTKTGGNHVDTDRVAVDRDELAHKLAAPRRAVASET